MGLQLLGVRYMFASSAAFQARAGVNSAANALPFVLLEDPYQSENTQPNTSLALPQIRIHPPTQSAKVFTGGTQPRLWPQADYVVKMWFWPHPDYHDESGNDDIGNEFLEAVDFVGKVWDEVRQLNGTDVTIGSTAVALPSLADTCTVDVFNSKTEDVAETIYNAPEKYRYFYFAQFQLQVVP